MEEGRKGGRKGGREEGREGGREGGWVGGREGGKGEGGEGGREGGRERESEHFFRQLFSLISLFALARTASTQHMILSLFINHRKNNWAVA